MNFITRLRPVCYKLKNDPSKIDHCGVIAQEVKQALIDIDKLDHFGGLSEDTFTDHEAKVTETRFGLVYTELIAPLIKAVQELNEKLEKNNIH